MERERAGGVWGVCAVLDGGFRGENKVDVRWMDGAWLGTKPESGESTIGTADGVVKARDCRRNPEEGGSWSNDGIDGFNGVPWLPYPGAGGEFEMKSRV